MTTTSRPPLVTGGDSRGNIIDFTVSTVSTISTPDGTFDPHQTGWSSRSNQDTRNSPWRQQMSARASPGSGGGSGWPSFSRQLRLASTNSTFSNSPAISPFVGNTGRSGRSSVGDQLRLASATRTCSRSPFSAPQQGYSIRVSPAANTPVSVSTWWPSQWNGTHLRISDVEYRHRYPNLWRIRCIASEKSAK